MRDKQREETRRRLYHAALEIFCRDGVANCRIEDIAQIAQVSRAAFYFHFPSKDDVLAELLRESEAPVSEGVEGLPDDASLEQVFEALITTMATFWSEGQRGKLLIEIFGVVMRRTEVVNDRDSEVVRAAMGRRFEKAAERGQLSNAIPSGVLCDFYLLNCFAAMASWSTQPIMPLVDMLRGVTMLFMHGAGPAK
jgi:AcrR family transcriptional regulator